MMLLPLANGRCTVIPQHPGFLPYQNSPFGWQSLPVFPSSSGHLPIPKNLFCPRITESSSQNSTKISPAKSLKSTKIFRPWLEEDKSDKSPSPPSAPLKNYVPNTSDPHLEEHNALEVLATNLGKSMAGHKCIYCGKIYSRKYGLKIHLRTHTGHKPMQCRICGRAFGDPSNLNKHTRLHSENGQPFKCHLCGKLLVRKRDLERHLISRHSSYTQKEEES